MKVIPSALVAELRGSTAELTAASWKGINYVRRKVVPANPNTTAQQAVRTSMTRCVTLWRSLLGFVKSWLDTYGTDYSMSGFNVFTSKNRAHEQVPEALKPVPDNPNVPVPTAFAAVAGAAGIIDITWTDDAPEDFEHIHLLARLVAGAVFDANKTPLASSEADDLTDLETGENYDVYGFWHNSTTGQCGTAASVMAVAAG